MQTLIVPTGAMAAKYAATDKILDEAFALMRELPTNWIITSPKSGRFDASTGSF
jgi:hypothetical protein